MFARAFCALAALVSTHAGEPHVYRFPDDPRIPLVDCDMSRGTAFRVGPHHYLSVNHVTENKNCSIDGKPIKVQGVQGDFSLFTVEGDEPGFLRIDCGGFVEGRKYIAVGHARGFPELTAVELVATGDRIGEFSLLMGLATVIPGQSGGPVLDALTGRVVGTVNTYNSFTGASGSVELKRTALCRRG